MCHLSDFDFGTFFGNGVSASIHTVLGRDCRGRPQGDYFYGCQVHIGILLWVSGVKRSNGEIIIFSVSVSSMWGEERGLHSFSAATRCLDGQTCSILHHRLAKKYSVKLVPLICSFFDYTLVINQGVGGDFLRCSFGSLLNRIG